MKSTTDRAFVPIKGRHIAIIWLLPFLYFPSFLFKYLPEETRWYWSDIFSYLSFQALFFVLLIAMIAYNNVDWKLMIAKPKNSDYLPSLKLTAFVFVFSIAAVYAIFYPLSYITPEFVNYWLIDLPPLIYWDGYQYPILANVLNLISLTILAPVIEELAFRGLLLRRWYEKWGMSRAILFSSALFGVMHTDPLGAMVFGIAMCVIYLKTQTLVIPIVCHAMNNLLAWLVEAGYIVIKGPQYELTLEDFQGEWIVGAVCAIASFIWAYIYVKGEKSKEVWRFPEGADGSK